MKKFITLLIASMIIFGLAGYAFAGDYPGLFSPQTQAELTEYSKAIYADSNMSELVRRAIPGYSSLRQMLINAGCPNDFIAALSKNKQYGLDFARTAIIVYGMSGLGVTAEDLQMTVAAFWSPRYHLATPQELDMLDQMYPSHRLYRMTQTRDGFHEIMCADWFLDSMRR